MPVNGSFQQLSLCGGCVQNEVGRRFVSFSGRPSSGLLLLGESPWEDEVRLGKPFAGAAGGLLDSQLKRAGLDRETVAVSNVMWCKPPWLDWVGKHPDSALALERCKPYWQELIRVLEPRVIVTLGAVALEQVLGVGGLDQRQSYVHDSPYGCPVVPSYHPAYILRGNHKLTQALFFALQRAKEVAAGGWQRSPVEYLIDPPPQQAEQYLYEGWREDATDFTTAIADGGVYATRDATADAAVGVRGGVSRPLTLPGAAEGEADPNPCRIGQAGGGAAEEGEAALRQWCALPPVPGFSPRIPLLVVDIETPNSHHMDEEEAEQDPSYTILRVGLSVAPGTALTVPWVEPYTGLVQEAIASAAVLVFWNGDSFDVPRLSFNGCRWPGEVHDAMWMWHWLQSDMLKALGFVAPFFCDLPPWKHLSGSELPYYTCCDADAEIRCYLGIRRAITGQGRWPRFVRHGIEAAALLRRDHLGRIYLDPQRQSTLKLRLEAERDEALRILQEMVPPEVKRQRLRKLKPSDPEHWVEHKDACACSMGTDQLGLPMDMEQPQS